MESRTRTDSTRTESTQGPIFSTGCCPPFDPEPWYERQLLWQDKAFLRDHVRCLFHVPLNMGSHITRDRRLIEAAQAAPAEPLMLCDDRSAWGADLFIAVSHAVPGARLTTLSGHFLTKVYEGPFRNAGNWARDMQRYVASKKLELEKLYFNYTTCPRCAKAYGKNYVVAFAKLREAEERASIPKS